MPYVILVISGTIMLMNSMLDLGASWTSSAPVMAGLGLFFVLRHATAPGSLTLHFGDRAKFVRDLTSVLDRLGQRPSGSTATGLDFGPKLAFRERLIGNKIVLVDFVASDAAVVSGPKQIVNTVEKRLSAL